MNDNEPTNTQLIAIANLEKSSLNVRKTLSRDAIEEMKASILSHGLIQNLTVTDAGDGSYHVVAGARRLTALRELQAEGKLPSDFHVPCRIVADDEAPELSLAENIVRLAMHPADQFEAFAGLIDKGQLPAQVAQRFGVEESLVLKRMKLARVAPELLHAFREDAISLESLMAFTITDDHTRQQKVYESLQGWQKDDPRHIRDMLTESMVDADSKLVRFVGMDAYQIAGGTVRSDLFGTDVYLDNPELLDALVTEKLRLIEQQLKAEGWGWIEISPERDWNFVSACGRIHPKPAAVPQELLDEIDRLHAELEAIAEGADGGEGDPEYLEEKQEAAEARLAEIESTIESLAAYDPEQMKTTGCYVTIDYDGAAFRRKGTCTAPGRETPRRFGRREAAQARRHAGHASPRPRSLPAPDRPQRDRP